VKDVLTGPVAQLNGRVTLWLARIAAVALASIAVITFIDVILRKVFNRGFTFTVEITELTMALIVFFGVGLVTHQRGHIVVDVVTLRLSDRIRVWLGLLINVLSLGFIVIVVWRLWLQAAFILSKGDTTPIWNFPLWPIAYVIAAGSLFLVTGFVLQVLDSWERTRDPAKPPTPDAVARPFQD
jgi:TRAP-type transport system small permease protein